MSTNNNSIASSVSDLRGVSAVYSAGARLLPESLRRLVLWSHMDFECAWSDMVYLVVDPSRVYRNRYLVTKTKHQWARDDPAFVYTMIWFLAVTGVAYAFAFRTETWWVLLKLMFSTILVDFLAMGCVIATIGWWLANRYLLVRGVQHEQQRVEWSYAFDIHCNSFFPFFLICYVLHFFFLPVLLAPLSFFSTVMANALFCAGFMFYFYNTWQGYKAMYFLENTIVFIYPSGVVAVVFLLLTLFNFNMAIYVANAVFTGRTL